MFGRGTVWSVLRRNNEACGIHKLRGRTPFSPSTQRSFNFLTPPVATHYFHAFRSHLLPKGEHVPHMRNFSKMVSAGAQHKEELKLLVSGGSRAQTVVAIWLLGCSIGVIYMVWLGSFTRLTPSGLSMTDWKFTGILPPLSDEEWLQEFDKYKQSPEYKRLSMTNWKFTGTLPPSSDEEWLQLFDKYKQSAEYKRVNRDMKIEEFKFIYWKEYKYRMWGRALGVMFALPFSYFLHKGYITLRLGSRLSALFALGAGQGLIGWWVKSGLEEPPSEYSQPRVSPYHVAAHLTSAIAIYCGLVCNALSASVPESQPPAESPTWVHAAKVRRLALPISVLVGLTAVYGAFVAGNDVGHAFNTFPKMGDTWIPQDIFEMKPLIHNFFKYTSTSQLGHCLLETATLISVGILWLSSRKLDLRPALPLGVAFGMAALQVTTGIFIKSYQLDSLPDSETGSMRFARQFGALVILKLMLLLNHMVRRPSLPLLKSLPQVVKAH